MDNNKKDNIFLSSSEIYTAIISVITVVFVAFMVYVNNDVKVFNLDRSGAELKVTTESNMLNNSNKNTHVFDDEDNIVFDIGDDNYTDDQILVSDNHINSSSKLENGTDSVSKSSTSSNATTVKAIVNINKASIEELKTLPGIGDVKAAIIIEYRSTNGPFLKIGELIEVKGIGDKTIEKLSSLICV